MSGQTTILVLRSVALAGAAFALIASIRQKNRVLALLALSVILGSGGGLLGHQIPGPWSIGISVLSFALSMGGMALLWRTTRDHHRERWEAARRAADLPPR
jgi:uncharacterized membrane protein YfcA